MTLSCGMRQPVGPSGSLCRMRRLFFTLFALATGLVCEATHIVGGELYYDHLGGDQYQVSLKLFRDCGPGNVNDTQYDGVVSIGVFGGDGTEFSVQTLQFPGSEQVTVTLNDPCLTAPPTICVELAIYTGVFTLPARPDGYHLTYQRCCRTPTIVNVPNAGDLGLTCTVRIPGSVVNNSSARFAEYPPIALCLDQDLIFDHSATDPDGDSLAYDLCTPFNGGTAFDPIPVPTAPPYTEIPWAAGYSETNQVDSDPGIAIDPLTGVLTVRPTLAASYTVAVRVKEYRAGVLLSETRRDFRFDVVPCQSAVLAEIGPQTDPGNDPCAGLEVAFVNASQTGQLWFWDFGDTGSESDTSSAFSPTWTYAEPGTYLITLINNPGYSCADTAIATFVVNEPLVVSFAAPGPVCGTLVTEFIAQGNQTTAATYSWQFGANATPQTASTGTVDVTFEGTGTSTVTLTVVENGCTSTFSDEVTAYPEPTAFYTGSPPSPQPYGTDILFVDGSTGNGSQLVAQEWTSSGNPVGSGSPLEWNSPLPGTYLIQLEVTTADGCTAIYQLPYEITEVPIIIPNVFTPNGDGSNEQFSIRNIEQHKNEFTVYNRWGMSIFQASNYRNQWSGLGIPDGTYFYELKLQNGNIHAGHLTLLR